jgi:hypothetical protein
MSDQVHMTEQAADTHVLATAVAVPEMPFTERQIDQFDADDGDAGRAIGKMLATFFLYTVIVMLGVGYWTFKRASVREARESAASASETKEGGAAESHGE